jgi:hypothetical protein
MNSKRTLFGNITGVLLRKWCSLRRWTVNLPKNSHRIRCNCKSFDNSITKLRCLQNNLNQRIFIHPTQVFIKALRRCRCVAISYERHRALPCCGWQGRWSSIWKEAYRRREYWILVAAWNLRSNFSMKTNLHKSNVVHHCAPIIFFNDILKQILLPSHISPYLMQ